MTPVPSGLVRRPTTAGLVLVALVTGLGLLSSLTGNTWLTAAAAAPAALGVVSVLGGVVSAVRLRGVAVAITGPDRARVGSSVAHVLHVAVPAGRATTIAGRIEQEGLEAAGFLLEADAGAAVSSLELDRAAVARGSSADARVLAEVTDVLRLFHWTRIWEVPAPVLVRPRRARAAPLPVSAGTAPGEGAPRPARTGDLAGVRAWQRGDGARDVHWRATARTGAPVVVVREETGTAVRAAVVLVGPVRDEHDEQRLAVCAATAARLRALDPTAAVAAVHPGGVLRAPPGPPPGVLDWWGGLVVGDRLGPVAVQDVLGVVPPGVGTVLVVGTGVLASTGWPELDRAAAGRGLTVRWVR